MLVSMISCRARVVCFLSATFLICVPAAFARSSGGKSSTAKASPTPTESEAKSEETKANTDWQLIKVGVRDYLTADNIAKFYGLLVNVDSSGKTVVFNNSRNQVQLTVDSREAII